MNDYENVVPDNEEMEKFLKALSKCRNCGHIKMAHSFLIIKEGRCIDARITKKGGYKECNCQTFAPKDNLAYLEWKYENKKMRKNK